MLERHVLERRNDGKKLFHNENEKKLLTATKKGIPIATSLAKPKLVRRVFERAVPRIYVSLFCYISILRYHENIIVLGKAVMIECTLRKLSSRARTQVRRISRSADDKEFGKYWKKLPKQMRRVDEEQELEDDFTMTTTPHRPRRDTDVHMLAFGSPPLSSINEEEGEEKTRRPSLTSSPGETPPFASTTTPSMSITPLRLVGPALKRNFKNKERKNAESQQEIEISFHPSSSASLNEEEDVVTAEEEEEEHDGMEEELPFAMHGVEDEIDFQIDASSSTTTNLTTEFERLKKSDSGIGELVAKCDRAPMLRSIEISRESGTPYSRRDVDRRLDFFESFEKTI